MSTVIFEDEYAKTIVLNCNASTTHVEGLQTATLMADGNTTLQQMATYPGDHVQYIHLSQRAMNNLLCTYQSQQHLFNDDMGTDLYNALSGLFIAGQRLFWHIDDVDALAEFHQELIDAYDLLHGFGDHYLDPRTPPAREADMVAIEDATWPAQNEAQS